MITLQFATQDGISDALIKWYSDGWATHVDTVLDDGTLLGARIRGGVQIRPPNYAVFARTLRVEIPMPAFMETAYVEWLKQQIPKPYDSEAILGMASARDWREPDSWMCSELETSALEHCGYLQWPLCTPANKVTPNGLLMVLSALVKI